MIMVRPAGIRYGSLGRLVFVQIRSIGVQLGFSALQPRQTHTSLLLPARRRMPTDHRGRCHAGAKASADGIATAAALPRSAAAGL
jgi:hypothetical protein